MSCKVNDEFYEYQQENKAMKYTEMRREYLKIMDDDRDIAQKWKLGTIDRKVAKEKIEENRIKRDALIEKIDSTIDKGRA